MSKIANCKTIKQMFVIKKKVNYEKNKPLRKYTAIVLAGLFAKYVFYSYNFQSISFSTKTIFCCGMQVLGLLIVFWKRSFFVSFFNRFQKRSFLKTTSSFWTFRKWLTIVSENDLWPFFKRSIFKNNSFWKNDL